MGAISLAYPSSTSEPGHGRLLSRYNRPACVPAQGTARRSAPPPPNVILTSLIAPLHARTGRETRASTAHSPGACPLCGSMKHRRSSAGSSTARSSSSSFRSVLPGAQDEILDRHTPLDLADRPVPTGRSGHTARGACRRRERRCRHCRQRRHIPDRRRGHPGHCLRAIVGHTAVGEQICQSDRGSNGRARCSRRTRYAARAGARGTERGARSWELAPNGDDAAPSGPCRRPTE